MELLSAANATQRQFPMAPGDFLNPAFSILASDSTYRRCLTLLPRGSAISSRHARVNPSRGDGRVGIDPDSQRDAVRLVAFAFDCQLCSRLVVFDSFARCLLAVIDSLIGLYYIHRIFSRFMKHLVTFLSQVDF